MWKIWEKICEFWQIVIKSNMIFIPRPIKKYLGQWQRPRRKGKRSKWWMVIPIKSLYAFLFTFWLNHYFCDLMLTSTVINIFITTFITVIVTSIFTNIFTTWLKAEPLPQGLSPRPLEPWTSIGLIWVLKNVIQRELNWLIGIVIDWIYKNS